MSERIIGAAALGGNHHGVDPTVRMASDIAAHLRHLPPAAAASAVAEHIRMFWDPRMRGTLLAAIDSGAIADPLVRAAAAQLPPVEARHGCT